MPSFKQVAVASALAGLSAAAPLEKKDNHKVYQVHNPKFARNGPAAYAKALAKYGASPEKISKVLSAAPSNVTTTPEQYDSEYLSPVQISGQTFKLDFDTGSSDLWVFGSGSAAGGSHTTYQPGSSASELQGETWKISYGDGSSASGNVYADTVTVGGTTVTQQAVEAATTVSAAFASGAPDGLLGLAFSSINTVTPTQQKTFFDNAVAQGLPATFAADLQAGKPGSYDFGALDSAYSDSDITYTAVDNSQGFWSFTPDSATIGTGASMAAGAGIADTGTTLMLVDDSIVDAYYQQVSGATNDAQQGGYVFDCSATLPDFTLTVGSHNAVVPGSYINYAPVDSTGQQCFGGIQSDSQIGFAIYGDVFLKSQYVVFDQSTGSPRLGLADKK
ncbi:MAG: Type I transmembrane sorting receptor [Stictis urceolatum]|nr:Type I transmembrane sorting receptor [Stictis urceolata]